MADGALDTRLCSRFHAAIELVGKRWSGAVVQLLFGGPARFQDLKRAVPEISDKMLSERLKELEAAGIVYRSVVPSTPVRIEYGLTPKGRALEASLSSLSEWAEVWLEAPPEGPPPANPSGATRREPAEADVTF